MENKIRENQLKRFQFLRKLFEMSQNEALMSVDAFEMGKQLGFTSDEINQIDDYLQGEGLVHRVAGTRIEITHQGILEVERALLKPDEPTTYFPSINIIYAGQIVSSQIQQGTSHSSQVLNYSSNDIESILKFLDGLKSQLPELKLAANAQAEVESDIATIESQARSPRPKIAVIKECLLSIKNVLEGIAGNVFAALLMQNIGRFL